ncbi:MAG: fibronectin type III domain-containing protein, partial [Nanobdellota archaeon]
DNFTVKTVVDPVANLTMHNDSTTYDNEINVTWVPPDDNYLDYYNLTVIIKPGDTFVGSFLVNGTENSTELSVRDLEYGEYLFGSIYAVDELGTESPIINSSSGVVFADNSPPEIQTVEIIPDKNADYNSNSSLHLYFNFTDNESGVQYYEYAVGTASCSSGICESGWNDLITVTTVNADNNDIELTGLPLVEGEKYYLSVRAKSDYEYANLWSGYYSSNSVTVDSQPPNRGYIDYTVGDQSYSLVEIGYDVGSDEVSSTTDGTLKYKRAPLSGAVCGSFSSWKNANKSLSGSGSTSYTIPDDGCYKFALFVYDEAGNERIYQKGSVSSNLSIDLTPPSEIDFITESHITHKTTLFYDWFDSVDPETGISHYRFGLVTDPNSNDPIGGWRNSSDSNATYEFIPSELTNGETYYLKVRAVNGFGDSNSVKTSPSILYFDTVTPEPLVPVSVADDADGSDGWIDTAENRNWTMITLTGEQDLSGCLWKTSEDFSYVVSAGLDSCDESSPGVYECNITNLPEGTHEVHIACRDDNGNAQSFDENTDLTLHKEVGSPLITITSPEEDSTQISELDVDFDLVDASPVNITMKLIDVSSGNVVAGSEQQHSGLVTGTHNFTIDLDGTAPETMLLIDAVDQYSRSTHKNVTFLINMNKPFIRIEDDPDLHSYNDTTFFVSDNFTINLSAYFFDSITYNLTDSSGDIIGNCHNSTLYSSVQNDSDNISLGCRINKSVLVSGEVYSFSAFASNDDPVADPDLLSHYIVADLEKPLLSTGSLAYDPPTDIFENDSLTLFSAWLDVNDINDVIFNYSIDGGSWQSLELGDGVEQISPRNWVPEESRYEAIIPEGQLVANASLDYRWIVEDVAGNVNASANGSVIIENQVPVINQSTTSFKGLDGYEFNEYVLFDDGDIHTQHNSTHFNCSLDDTTYFNAFAVSGSECRLWWHTGNAENGTYNLNLTVFDLKDGVTLSNDSTVINITIVPTEYQNITVDSGFNSLVEVAYMYNSSLVSGHSSFNSQDIETLVEKRDGYDVMISSDRLTVTAKNISSSDATPSYYYRKYYNISDIRYVTDSLGNDLTHVPKLAYAASANFSNASEYVVSFNVSGLGLDTSRLSIFKYNDTDFGIDYSSASGYGKLDTVIDGNIVSATVDDFSAFILAEEIVPEQSNESSSTSSSSSSSGSSGGSFGGVSIGPEPNCSDNIMNQGEIGIDCGGPCEASCSPKSDASEQDSGDSAIGSPEPSCSDGIRNQGELDVDCGGPCAPCKVATCYDGIRNQGEEKIDCGGPCPACDDEHVASSEPDLEKPESSTMPVFLWILLSVIAVTGIGIFAFKTHGFRFSHEHVGVGHEHGMNNENIARVARFIAKELGETNCSIERVKEHLLSHGIERQYVDTAAFAFANTTKVSDVLSYLDNYSEKGYSPVELEKWLLEKGIPAGVVAIAYDIYNDPDENNPLYQLFRSGNDGSLTTITSSTDALDDDSGEFDSGTF